MYHSLLIATDGSDTAAKAAEAATGLAKALGATLHVVVVYKAGRPGSLRVPEMTLGGSEGIDRGSIAETQAESVAAHARTLGVEAHTHATSGDVADRVVATAEDLGVDVIVIGNKGMRGVKRVLGSIPNAVAHKAPCAVLIVNTA